MTTAMVSPNGGYSLNDCLLLEPLLQDDVFDVLIRYRPHQYAFSADVTKMYRQVALDESNRDSYWILWRDYMTDEIQELDMSRVMYSVASASYHSTRIFQASGKNLGSYPNTVNAILNEFWVGADTLKEECVLQIDLIESLNKNCPQLRKWSSNKTQLVVRLPKDLQEAGKAYKVLRKPFKSKPWD